MLDNFRHHRQYLQHGLPQPSLFGWHWELSLWGPPSLFFAKRDKEVPLKLHYGLAKKKAPPTTRRTGLLPAPQWLFLKRLLYSFSILVSGKQSPSLTQRLDLLDPREPLGVYVMVVSLRPALRKGFNHTLHHVPTTYRPPFQHISTLYCCRIVSVLFPLLEARTIGGR